MQDDVAELTNTAKVGTDVTKGVAASKRSMWLKSLI